MKLHLTLIFLGACLLNACVQDTDFKTGNYIAEYPGDVKAGLLKFFGNGFYSLGDSISINEDGTFEYFSRCNDSESFGRWIEKEDRLILKADSMFIKGNLVLDETQLTELIFDIKKDNVLTLEENTMFADTKEKVVVKYLFVLQP